MSRPAPLQLPAELGRTLLAEARAAGDFEICGFIAATDSGYARYAVANRAAHALDRFDMAPADQAAAFEHMRRGEQTLRAIYHSHPRGEARPSSHDRRGHNHPQTAALIMAPAAAGAALRAWRLAPDAVVEVDIEWSEAAWRDNHGSFL